MSVQTREDILRAAFDEFADKGLAGARMDDIAAAVGTRKATLYYYFPSKEDLYIAVLGAAYKHMRDAEQSLALEHLPPVDALAALVRFTYDYDNAHPKFVRIVSNENLQYGAFIGRTENPKGLNRPILDTLRAVLDRGQAAGVFRREAGPLDLHYVISALCFFSVSNRHTFHMNFPHEPDMAADPAHRREVIVETVLRSVLVAGAPQTWRGGPSART
jgi:AcrR family transcriptional regulator